MLKKLLSVIISVLIVVSVFSSFSAFATENETEILGPGVSNDKLPAIAEGCNRYFFYLPKSWENEFTQTAGIYWWEGTGAHDSWPGVEANKADAEGLYYYDVPKDVTSVFWNNFLDGGRNFDSPIYEAAQTSGNVCTEYYEAGESPLYPDGLESFNNMVYVINFDECNCNDFVYPHTFGGDWYFYYGNGEYGTTPEKGEVFYTERYRGNIYSHGKPSEPSTLPEVSQGYNRYFFYMPDYWYNDYTDTAGIYWWEGTGAQSSWPGVKANKTDVENVYYYDVPKDVTTIIWNNYVDLLMEVSESLYYLDIYTINVPASGYDPEESATYPDGIETFDGMIFVTGGIYNTSDFIGKLRFTGEWYYYYGNGEYGTTPNRGDGEVYTDSVKMGVNDLQPPILGDADENKTVNIKDVTCIQKFVAGVEGVNVFELNGDVDKNGTVNVKDATAIQKHLAGMDTNFEIGDYTWFKN